MTKALQDAIERLKQVPEDRQDALAAFLLNELDEDERWLKSTVAHSEKLRGFVQGVLEANRRGEYEPLDPDQLQTHACISAIGVIAGAPARG